MAVGHKREAGEALARGERLERISPQASGTQSGTDENTAERATVAKAGSLCENPVVPKGGLEPPHPCGH